MKRSLLLFLLLTVLWLSVACSADSQPFPDLTGRQIECRFTLTVDATPYEISLRRAPVGEGADGVFSELTDATLTVEAPSHLAGLTVRLADNTAYLSVHGMEIPVRREELGGMLRLFQCFSTPAEQITEVRTASLTPEQTAVTYDGPYGTFTLFYGEDMTVTSAQFLYGGHTYSLTDLHFAGE